jgi:hypothetical protein
MKTLLSTLKTFSIEFGTTGPQALWEAESLMDIRYGLVQSLEHFVSGGPLDAPEFIACGSTQESLLGYPDTLGHFPRP